MASSTPSAQVIKRLHQACTNCKRKKTRCPGEKPACSSCVRLNQICSYHPRARRNGTKGPVEERLSNVEEQLSRILGDVRSTNTPQIDQSPIAPHVDEHLDHILAVHSAGSTISESTLSKAKNVYIEKCHRQPIWCLDPAELRTSINMSDEQACSLLSLTPRFSPELGDYKTYLMRARTAIMLSIATNSVELSTLQNLCLLAYSYFLGGDCQLGRFYVSLGSQLGRSAMLDRQSTYMPTEPSSEVKTRLFWSFQILEQIYGTQLGRLRVTPETWQLDFGGAQDGTERNVLSSQDDINLPSLTDPTSTSSDVWDHSVHVGWVWSMVREYVTDAAANRIKEPWRQDSEYTRIMANLMQIETRMPLRHRYDTLKFYQRLPEELNSNRHYWKPWLKLQFSYHTIHITLNHPFLYISISQLNPGFSGSNSFWRKSKELVLSHATWIARMVDMVEEKQIRLTDPFFAYAAGVAATVHLYYCCAESQKVRSKSRADLAKCLGFINSFVSFSPLCKNLQDKVRKLIQIASGFEEVELSRWNPSKIHLSSNMMWEILGFASDTDRSLKDTTLFRGSLQPKSPKEIGPQTTFEVTVAPSPDVAFEVSDSGQALPGLTRATGLTPPRIADGTNGDDIIILPAENLQAKLPWMWQTNPDIIEPNGVEGQDFSSAMFEDAWNQPWWEIGNL